MGTTIGNFAADGSFAAEREEQVLEWAQENPYTSFSGKGITEQLFKEDPTEGRDITKSPQFEKVIRAYEVACEDLARKQILKRTREGVFILKTP